MIISIANNKGGVGKTTTTINLSEALARKGKSVLVVDIDGQASASMAFGVDRKDLSPSLSNVFYPAENPDKRDYIKDVIRKNVIPNVDLITADMDLYSFDVIYSEEKAISGGELDIYNLLGKELNRVKKYYDYILIDCAPAFSLLTINALLASDGCIIPITPNYFAAEGFQNFLNIVERIAKGLKQDAEIIGIFVNMIESRTLMHRDMIELLKMNFGDLVFGAEIFRSIKFQEAPSHGKTIREYDPTNRSIEAYSHLADEVIERSKKYNSKKVIQLKNTTQLKEASA